MLLFTGAGLARAALTACGRPADRRRRAGGPAASQPHRGGVAGRAKHAAPGHCPQAGPDSQGLSWNSASLRSRYD
jgi:hypothetical protein